MTLSRLSAVAFAGFMLGCAEATGPRVHGANDIQVVTAADHLTIENQGSEPFFYAAFDMDLLIRALLAPFTTDFPSLAPGERVAVAYQDLFRHNTQTQNTKTAVVYWWFLEDAGANGVVPWEKVRSVRVAIDWVP